MTGSKRLDTILAKARAASDSDTDEWPFQAAAAGEALDEVLADPANLVRTSRQVVKIAHELGCDRVMGASPLGQRLAGAAVALGRNGLKDQSAGVRGKSVLVVDGILVSGVSIASASRRALEAGARRISALVVASTHAPSEQLCRLADPIVILEG